MKYFNLPDLGEGLPEAEIVQWHVKPGDRVETDQILVEVETAKAVVEVPSPISAKVVALFGAEGDVIHTGEPLLEFETESSSTDAPQPTEAAPSTEDVESEPVKAATEDSGTVVGKLQTSASATEVEPFFIGAPPSSRNARHGVVTPAVRALALRLGVSLDNIHGSGPEGHITAEDVQRAHREQSRHGEPEMLRGVRRTMAKTMEKAHAEVVPVTIVEDVDIHHWPKGTDITIRLVQAIARASREEPALNGWFYGENLSRRLRQQVDVGIAVDTEEGLFVPVLRDVANRSADDLRAGLDSLREDVLNRSIPPSEMQGATITLSNYGSIAGRYASPVVVPPQIAIVGAGRLREEVVPFEGAIAIHPILPLSLTFDHRAATGGEAARFLKAVRKELQKRE